MKQKTIQMPESNKKQQATEKTIIDPNWLYYLREAERNEKQVINR